MDRMDLLRLHPDDNVAVALRPLAAGESVEGVVTTAAVAAMHKLAVRAIAHGERILKYGQPIGIASRDTHPGEHVHIHNCAMLDVRIASPASARASAGS